MPILNAEFSSKSTGTHSVDVIAFAGLAADFSRFSSVRIRNCSFIVFAPFLNEGFPLLWSLLLS